MHQFRSWIYFLIAILNLIVTIPLAKLYGGVGAAFGTAISLIIGNGFIMNWYYHVKVGLDMKFFWKQIISFVPALLVPILSGVLFNHFFDLYIIFNFLLFGILYVIIFFISIWFIGINQYEKDLIGKPLKKALKRNKVVD